MGIMVNYVITCDECGCTEIQSFWNTADVQNIQKPTIYAFGCFVLCEMCYARAAGAKLFFEGLIGENNSVGEKL